MNKLITDEIKEYNNYFVYRNQLTYYIKLFLEERRQYICYLKNQYMLLSSEKNTLLPLLYRKLCKSYKRTLYQSYKNGRKYNNKFMSFNIISYQCILLLLSVNNINMVYFFTYGILFDIYKYFKRHYRLRCNN